MYHTTDLTGADVVATGVVVAPTGKPPEGGRPIVGWGHPTTGSAVQCAPSNGLDPFDLVEGLHDLLADGYVVAYADYPGMGTPGPNSYLVGVSEANSILDAVRAARQIPETGAGADLLLWGHSQGGQAVLFAAQGAAAYAPELTLRAAAVAAPAADLSALLDADIDDVSGVTIGSYAFAAYQSVYAARFPGLAAELDPHRRRRRGDPEDGATVPVRPEPRPAQDRRTAGRELPEGQPRRHRTVGDDAAREHPGRNTTAGAAVRRAGRIRHVGRPERHRTRSSPGSVPPATHVIYQTFPKTGHGMIALKAVPAVRSFFKSALVFDVPASTC